MNFFESSAHAPNVPAHCSGGSLKGTYTDYPENSVYHAHQHGSNELPMAGPDPIAAAWSQDYGFETDWSYDMPYNPYGTGVSPQALQMQQPQQRPLTEVVVAQPTAEAEVVVVPGGSEGLGAGSGNTPPPAFDTLQLPPLPSLNPPPSYGTTSERFKFADHTGIPARFFLWSR